VLFFLRRAARLAFGGLAQLGERLLCKQEVIGSIPIVSTRFCSAGGLSLGVERGRGTFRVCGYGHRVTTRSFGSARRLLPIAWEWRPLLFGTEGGVLRGLGCCGLLQCESGSGASLGVPRSAKSDRMCGCSDVSASETAATCVQRRCKMLS
jgi:hypothetical protein